VTGNDTYSTIGHNNMTSSLCSTVVTMALSCTVFDIFDFEFPISVLSLNAPFLRHSLLKSTVTLKLWLGVAQGH